MGQTAGFDFHLKEVGTIEESAVSDGCDRVGDALVGDVFGDS